MHVNYPNAAAHTDKLLRQRDHPYVVKHETATYTLQCDEGEIDADDSQALWEHDSLDVNATSMKRRSIHITIHYSGIYTAAWQRAGAAHRATRAWQQRNGIHFYHRLAAGYYSSCTRM